MIKLGITGGIGSGKSTVSKIFEILDIPVYIADTESKKLTASSPIIRERIIQLLGEELYNGNQLNKAKLASYIFTDEKIMAQVNAIIHPQVEKHFEEWVRNQKSSIVAHEAAILFESGFNKLMDKVLTVYTPLEIRIERTMARDKSSRKEVLDRINNQMSDEEKLKLSDFVILNDGSKSLIKQAKELIEQLKRKV